MKYVQAWFAVEDDDATALVEVLEEVIDSSLVSGAMIKAGTEDGEFT